MCVLAWGWPWKTTKRNLLISCLWPPERTTSNWHRQKEVDTNVCITCARNLFPVRQHLENSVVFVFFYLFMNLQNKDDWLYNSVSCLYTPHGNLLDLRLKLLSVPLYKWKEKHLLTSKTVISCQEYNFFSFWKEDNFLFVNRFPSLHNYFFLYL